MRQRGRPRRSSMPAVAHNKLFDCPYSRQQSPPEPEHNPMDHFYSNMAPGDEEDSQQLSDRYSRIQLVDQWPSSLAAAQQQGQFGAPTNSTISAQQQQHFFQDDPNLTTTTEPVPMQYSEIQQHNQHQIDGDYEQLSQEDDDDDDEDLDDDDDYAGPSNTKRKRAFSFSSAPLCSTTNTLTSTMTGAMNGHGHQQVGQAHAAIGGTTTEKRPATKICRVCGDKAYSYNFNVITCESCKAFFRRNANKEKEIRCPFNEQCDINVVSRRFCQRCRLQKCFRVGMKKEWIMSEEARLEKKQRIQENRERRAAAAAASELGQQLDGPTEALMQQAQQRLIQKEDGLLLPDESKLSLLQQQTLPAELQCLPNQQQQQAVLDTLPTSILAAAQAPQIAAAQAEPIQNPLVALPGQFLQPSTAAAIGGPPLLNATAAAAANNEQAIAAAQVAAVAQVAAAAQACAVQQAVNQAAAAVLLHHHQQQQQQSHQNDIQMQQQQTLHQPHEPSPPHQQQQSPEDSSATFPPPVVGIPVASSTSIHTTVANGELPAPPPSHALAAFIPAAANPTAAEQPPPPPSLIETTPSMDMSGHQQGGESILGSLVPAAAPIMMTSASTDTTSVPTLPPAAAVAAAVLIQQQQNNPQMLAQTVPSVPATNVVSTSSIQQQLAAAQHAQQVQQLVEQHHQQQQQNQAAQQQAAAAAVAQLQQQVQAQHQAAQIVAHAQHQIQMVQQQQQQLAAFANVAAAAHHQQQQQQQAQQVQSHVPLLVPQPPQMSAPLSTAEATVNQHLQNVANAFSTGSHVSPNNGSPSALPPAPNANGLPSFMEVAAHLAIQPNPPPPTLPANPQPPASAVMPVLMPSSATASMLIQQQQQQHQLGGSGQQNSMAQPQNVQVSAIPPQPTLAQAAIAVQAANHQMQLNNQIIASQQAQAVQQVQQQQQQLNNHQHQEMVSIPRDILMKLVEQRLEAERNQLQTPTKCQCHCQCGRYPNDMFIVDKVMADLLESSSKHLVNGSDNQSSTNSTPRLSQQFQTAQFQAVNGPSALGSQQELPQQQAPIEAMDTSAALSGAQLLSQADQEQLTELAKANELWKNTAVATTSGLNADLQLLMGHYTESDLRRLIGIAKSLECFKRLEQHDQERLLKGCFGSFFVLRSLLKVDTSEYSLSMMRQNGIPESTIKFYSDFPPEWRRNEMVNILLGMQLLFNVEVAGLQSAISVTVENMKFQSLLKRLLFVLCDRDSHRADAVSAELMIRLEQLKQLFPASNSSTTTNQTVPIFGGQNDIIGSS